MKVSERRYAHKSCAEAAQQEISKEDLEREELNNCITRILKLDYVTPRVQKQIKEYKEKYNYSYSGMARSLEYFYEVKGNSIDKANGGIGIIPYIYKQAYDYYRNLWEIKQKNEPKIENISRYVPSVKEITIKKPVRQPRKRELFTFLDEEETNGK